MNNISSETWKIIITASATLVAVGLGSFLSYWNSYRLFKKQKRYENQRISYSKICAIKITWLQLVITFVEAKLTRDFFDSKYYLFSKEKSHLEIANKHSDRCEILVKEVSKEQKDFFETLGIIQTCFKIDSELEEAINEIYNFKTIHIENFSGFRTEKELNDSFDRLVKGIEPWVRNQYGEKIDNLIRLLKSRLE